MVRRFLALVFCMGFAAGMHGAELAQSTPLQKLSSALECNRCSGWLLPGKILQHPKTPWGMISDLPESFRTHGVLYSSRMTLPPNGGAPEMLKQRTIGGFEAIDGGFDVFLFHLLKETTASARIVVYARNLGSEPVTLLPRQVIKTEGTIGTVHEFESSLAMRVLTEDWDSSAGETTVAPGKGAVVGFSRQFGNVPNGPDSSHNVNCFGYVRVEASPQRPGTRLEVSVIAIPAGPRERMLAEAERLLNIGALSTDEVPLDKEPEGCALKRAVGVYRNFVWRSDPLVIDVGKTTTDTLVFPMALPAIQTAGCEAARQTQDLSLRPGYTREDTIGNYMIEYDVRMIFTNSGGRDVATDVLFSKSGADVGLAWQVGVNLNAPDHASWEQFLQMPNPYRGLSAQWAWAGPKQKSKEKSFLPQPLSVPAGGQTGFAAKFLIAGNSSLPFDLVVRAKR